MSKSIEDLFVFPTMMRQDFADIRGLLSRGAFLMCIITSKKRNHLQKGWETTQTESTVIIRVRNCCPRRRLKVISRSGISAKPTGYMALVCDEREMNCLIYHPLPQQVLLPSQPRRLILPKVGKNPGNQVTSSRLASANKHVLASFQKLIGEIKKLPALLPPFH